MSNQYFGIGQYVRPIDAFLLIWLNRIHLNSLATAKAVKPSSTSDWKRVGDESEEL